MKLSFAEKVLSFQFGADMIGYAKKRYKIWPFRCYLLSLQAIIYIIRSLVLVKGEGETSKTTALV